MAQSHSVLVLPELGRAAEPVPGSDDPLEQLPTLLTELLAEQYDGQPGQLPALADRLAAGAALGRRLHRRAAPASRGAGVGRGGPPLRGRGTEGRGQRTEEAVCSSVPGPRSLFPGAAAPARRRPARRPAAPLRAGL